MGARSDRGKTSAWVVLGLGAAALVGAPGACLYPEYSFTEPEPAGGGGSGSATSTGGPSSATGAGLEDCLNREDDDSDGAVDCADPDCGAYQCVASAPVGWEGHFALFVGAPEGVPECPTEFPSVIPYTGNATVLADPALCTACSCGDPAGETCDLADAVTVIDTTCANPVKPTLLSVPPDWDGSCFSGTTAPGGKTTCGASGAEPCNKLVTMAAPKLTGGTCAASGGDATVAPVTWATVGKACTDAPEGGGCSGGQVCQPVPSGGYKPGVCIYKEGINDCPGAPFLDQHIFYAAHEDTRGCTPCACDPATGGSCSAQIKVWTNDACSTVPTTFQTGTCGNLGATNPTVAGRSATITSTSPGSCTPASTGGQPTGEVIPSKPSTFCCVP